MSVLPDLIPAVLQPVAAAVLWLCVGVLLLACASPKAVAGPPLLRGRDCLILWIVGFFLFHDLAT